MKRENRNLFKWMIKNNNNNIKMHITGRFKI